MTAAQRRLVDAIRAAGDCAEYWPIVNDWVRGDKGDRLFALSLHNINRTVAALTRAGVITIDDDGFFHLTENDGRRTCPTCDQRVQWLKHPTPHFVAHFDLARQQWCSDPRAQLRK